MTSVARSWGSTPAEREAAYPCDRHLPAVEDQLFRAVDVDAPSALTFRWLCQLRAAPYSYDLIDNWGRRSPKTLTPGLEQLEVGQRFMKIFELVEFEQGSDLTLRVVRAEGVFGNLAVTYRVVPSSERSCRVIVKVALTGGFGRLPDRLAPSLDLFMMRKQLLTLKMLAERDAGALPEPAPIDEHCIQIAAAPADVWPQLWPVMVGAMGAGVVKNLFARAVGVHDLPDRLVQRPEPGAAITGFRVSDLSEPRLLELGGEHRFSRYRLTFRLRPAGSGTRLCAQTRADFPGLKGQLYKTAVIRTRFHVLATRSILRAVKNRAER